MRDTVTRRDGANPSAVLQIFLRLASLGTVMNSESPSSVTSAAATHVTGPPPTQFSSNEDETTIATEQAAMTHKEVSDTSATPTLDVYKRKRVPSAGIKSGHPRHKKHVRFALSLTETFSSLTLQGDLLEWPTVNEDELLSSDDVPEDYAFQGVAQTSWTLVQQHLGIAEKCHGRAVLAHNGKIKHVLPSWSLGVTQVPSLMIPPRAHDSYCELVRRQAADRMDTWFQTYHGLSEKS